MQSNVLLISCPDQPGIVAKVTGLLYESGLNILTLEQHVEADERFFMRVYADAPGTLDHPALKLRLSQLSSELKAGYSWHDPAARQRVAILVTSEEIPLYDLLIRQASGRLPCEISMVISNRPDLEHVAKAFGVAFHHVPLAAENQAERETAMAGLLDAAEIDLVVLARYMKILSGAFVGRFAGRIINIHHSFLPAFKGNKPYHQAWERGVKLIGATAHYVVEELDAGPIIAQDVRPVSHEHSPEQMAEAGREIERAVLSAAVKAHLEHRIILHQRRTIVFGQ